VKFLRRAGRQRAGVEVDEIGAGGGGGPAAAARRRGRGLRGGLAGRLRISGGSGGGVRFLRAHGPGIDGLAKLIGAAALAGEAGVFGKGGAEFAAERRGGPALGIERGRGG